MNRDSSISTVGSFLLTGSVIVSITGLVVLGFLHRNANTEQDQVEVVEEKKLVGFRFKHYNKQKKFTVMTEIQPTDEKVIMSGTKPYTTKQQENPNTKKLHSIAKVQKEMTFLKH